MVLVNLLIIKVTLIWRLIWFVPIREECGAVGLLLRIDCRVICKPDRLGYITGSSVFGGGEIGLERRDVWLRDCGGIAGGKAAELGRQVLELRPKAGGLVLKVGGSSKNPSAIAEQRSNT